MLPGRPGRNHHGKIVNSGRAHVFAFYAFDAPGKPLGECRLDEPGAEIVWTVSLANKKASWHEFQVVS